jgi:hypothetical protein
MRRGLRLVVGLVAVVGFSASVGGGAVRAANTTLSAAAASKAATTHARGANAVKYAASSTSQTSSYGPKGDPGPGRIDCGYAQARCLDLEYYTSVGAYGRYVGHDEPSNPFYSFIPGSGSQVRWQVKIPTEPGNNPSDSSTWPTRTNGKVWNFMLHPAFWFGMAMCNDMSYPEVHTTLGSCKPGSDSNIADCPDSTGTTCVSTANGCPPGTTGSACYIGNHVGSAYMEFQFYPPGWAPLSGNAPIGGESCDPTRWCAAMVIWSLQNDGNFAANNADCVNNSNGGAEFGNASFVTLGATSLSPVPASPYKNPGAFAPTPSADQFYNGGDVLTVTMHDIPDNAPGPAGSGLEISVFDQTTGTTGHVVASGRDAGGNAAFNHFATLKWDPSATSCTVIPYNFHPMYSTSNLHTRVPWAAHTYNIDFTDEIGHFDYCTVVTKNNSLDPSCSLTNGLEGPSSDSEGADTANPVPIFGSGTRGWEETVCYDGTSAGTTTLVPLSGCLGTNIPGFDGSPYQPNAWPDGNTTLRPQPIRYTSPLTGPNYDQNYSDTAFESNMPALEFTDSVQGGASTCSIFTGVGCTWQPPTDDNPPRTPTTGQPSLFGFYPWFSIDTHDRSQCWWLLGQDVSGQTSNDFNTGVPDSQYGPPYNAPFEQTASPPATAYLVEDFHSTGTPSNTDLAPWAMPNPCNAAPSVLTAAVPESPMIGLLPTVGIATGLVAAIGVRRFRTRSGKPDQTT